MTYGFSVLGNSGQLVIDEENPILTQMYKGDIIVNNPMGLGYGWCTVMYPQMVTTSEPPFVFAVPTPNATYCGIGMFLHEGSQGEWTGFTVLITRHIMGQDGTVIPAGFNTGWQYRVAGFGLAGENGFAEYGLRIMNEYEDITFDSAWPVVKFRGLMGGWVSQGFTRGYAVGSYWGYQELQDGVSDDQVLAMGTHAWGHADLTTGFMMSGNAGAVVTRMDLGRYDLTINAIVTMGFPDGNRSNLWAVAYFGSAQHPSGSLEALKNWNLLTADFTSG